MNKKIIIVVSIIIGILAILGAMFILLRGKKTLTPEETKELLIKQATPSESGPDVLIVVRSNQEGLYGNPRFEIQYQKPFDLFLISILARPMDEVRKEAEEALLGKTGKNLNSLCQLKVMTTAPNFIAEGQVIANPEKLNICSDQ
ncbi:MAG: hypothetical protein WC628_10095 [Candidatus Omnitrophota bacterium]